MYPRVKYEMTDDDLKSLLDACKPTPAILVGEYTPSSPQENANRAWQALGEKMGFDHTTVKPIAGNAQTIFSAVPSETTEQKKERKNREAEEKRLSSIQKLENEIKERQIKLNDLLSSG